MREQRRSTKEIQGFWSEDMMYLGVSGLKTGIFDGFRRVQKII
jgi:hypothetical protein